MNTQTIKAKVNTKSNYKGLNGQWLSVKEIVGTRVSCQQFSEDFQTWITIDFNLSEITELSVNEPAEKQEPELLNALREAYHEIHSMLNILDGRLTDEVKQIYLGHRLEGWFKRNACLDQKIWKVLSKEIKSEQA